MVFIVEAIIFIVTCVTAIISKKRTTFYAIVGVSFTFGQFEEHDIFTQLFDRTTIPSENHEVKANGSVTFICPGVNENTKVELLEWQSQTKLKVVLRYKPSTGVSVDGDWKDRAVLNKDYSVTINKVNLTDSGEYTCAINHRLIPEVIHKFYVIDIPDAPGRPLIIHFTSRTVNLSWASPKYTNRTLITHYTVIIKQYNEKPDLPEEAMARSTNYTVRLRNTTGNFNTIHINGLRPYTVHNFAIMAWNNIGPSEPSKPSYFMVTLVELPEALVWVSARNLSATSIFVTWTMPDLELIHGEFIGYCLSFSLAEEPNKTTELHIRNGSMNRHVIGDLRPHTKYKFHVGVQNALGCGKNQTIQVLTDEGPPTSPRNVSITNITETSLTVQALAPIRPNGILKGYRVYLTYNNFTDTRTYKDNPEEPIKTFVLDDLKPDTVYSVAVKAFSGKHEGAISQLAVGRTDINGPSPPILRNVSCELNNSIIVQMDRPEVFTGSVDMYFIDLYESGFPVDQMDIPTDKRYLQTSYTFRNVTPNMHYDVQVYAATRSNRTGNLIFGAKSNFVQVFVNEGCRIPSAPFADLWAGIFAGLICAISILILGGGGYLIWKKYLQPPYYYLDGTQIGPAGLEWNDPPPPRDPEAEQNPENPEQQVHYIGPIAIAQFHEHVAQLHADGDIGFSKEYDAIQNDPTNEGNSSENSQHPDNKPKNRYLNIIAYDHSRVQLLTMPGQKTSCYINANYIDGFMVSRAYIGTQGPLPSTFDCFWRMIWEQRVTIIVMITNLVERGRRKCDMYWPKEGTEKYGPIEVKLVKEDVMATFTVRTMVIRHSRVQVKRPKDISLVEKTVYQYHYTNWPDHGTPDHPLPVISFVRKSSTANPRNSGPIVVHCSAGVGRTGTYIVIEAMLKQIKAREEINIFGFLRHIRSQRNFLVQTEEQYIFIHDALIEAIDSGDTDIPGDLYHKFVRFLQIPGSRAPDGCQWKTLEQQFAQVVKFKPREFNLVSAHKLVNRRKNRCAVVVPMENSRVHLTPRPGEDGSDYINASWFPGFRSLREYVVTQHPLVKEDFWKLIYDHNIQMIVMLSVISGTEYQVFWPQENEEIKTDVYTCSQVEVTKVVPFLTREFVLKSVQDDFQFKTKFVEALNWPHDGVATIKNMYDFPNYILGLQKDDRGPICVVDRFGGTEAAIFCTLLTVKRQLAFDGSADPYMYAKLYHNKRPGIWVSADDYMKLHFAVQTLCTDIDDNIPNIPPDKYSISDGMPIKQRISITNNNAHEQLSEYSRSPDGFPGHVVAVNIEDDGVRPSTSKEGDEHHKLRNSERVPPEGMESDGPGI